MCERNWGSGRSRFFIRHKACSTITSRQTGLDWRQRGSIGVTRRPAGARHSRRPMRLVTPFDSRAWRQWPMRTGWMTRPRRSRSLVRSQSFLGLPNDLGWRSSAARRSDCVARDSAGTPRPVSHVVRHHHRATHHAARVVRREWCVGVRRTPNYTSETIDTVWLAIREWLAKPARLRAPCAR